MKTYKVLKSFPSSDGGYDHLEGSIYKPTKSVGRTKKLVELGYIEENPDQPKSVWDLKDGERYFYINWRGDVERTSWDGTPGDEEVREWGNCFITEEVARQEVDRCKAKVILLQDTKGFEPDWKDREQAKWCVVYDYELGDFEVDCFDGRIDFGVIYFATEKDAYLSIRDHREEWLKYLGVKNG